jgi:MFS family permease
MEGDVDHEGRGADPAPISPGYSYYVLALLFFVYVFNFVDRQVLAILLVPIQEDLGVSDTFMGALTGFAFALFYTFAGIPIARLADRASRRSIIALGLVVWSSMTAVSGLARTGLHLAVARIGVGIGEAAGTPPAHSLLSDYFGPERRATALSIYAMGVYIGVAAGFMGGGWLATQFGWRVVFGVVGLAGIPLAVLVRTTIRELPRGFSDPGSVQHHEPAPFWQTIGSLLRNRSLVFIVLATSLQSLWGYGILAWGPTFLIRVHGMELAEVGFKLGLPIGLLGGAGVFFGGWLADRYGRDDPRWYMRLPAIECALVFPLAILFILADSQLMAMVFFCPLYFVGAMYVGPMHSTIQGLVVPSQRAMASAANLFTVNMLGLGMGPLVIGLLNDALASNFGDASIRWSMMVAAVLGSGSSVLFWLSSRTLPRDLQTARDATQGR